MGSMLARLPDVHRGAWAGAAALADVFIQCPFPLLASVQPDCITVTLPFRMADLRQEQPPPGGPLERAVSHMLCFM